MSILRNNNDFLRFTNYILTDMKQLSQEKRKTSVDSRNSVDMHIHGGYF